MDGRNPDMFEPYKMCSVCNQPILDNQIRLTEFHIGTGAMRTIHRKCRVIAKEK